MVSALDYHSAQSSDSTNFSIFGGCWTGSSIQQVTNIKLLPTFCGINQVFHNPMWTTYEGTGSREEHRFEVLSNVLSLLAEN